MNDSTNFTIKGGEIYKGAVGFKIYNDDSALIAAHYGDGEF